MGISLALSSRGQLPPPHTLSSTLLAVVLMRSSAIVGIGLLWSAHTLSSTSSGAHTLICCRGHRPLVVSSLPPHTLSSTSSGAHALICCRGHRPLVVCSLPHALSHLPAVVLMRSSAVVDIVLSRSAPSPPHTLSLSSTSCGAHTLICCRGHRPLEVCSLPHSLSHLLAVGLSRVGGESSVSLALPRASE